MRRIVFALAMIGVLALTMFIAPLLSHGQEPPPTPQEPTPTPAVPPVLPPPKSITIVGEMPREIPGWIDTKILCDSRENEFVVVFNRGAITITAIPGGCKSKL